MRMSYLYDCLNINKIRTVRSYYSLLSRRCRGSNSFTITKRWFDLLNCLLDVKWRHIHNMQPAFWFKCFSNYTCSDSNEFQLVYEVANIYILFLFRYVLSSKLKPRNIRIKVIKLLFVAETTNETWIVFSSITSAIIK